MECVSVDADWIFEVFTRGSRETAVFILDVRPYKFFKRRHIIHAYCIRVTADKTILAVSPDSYLLHESPAGLLERIVRYQMGAICLVG